MVKLEKSKADLYQLTDTIDITRHVERCGRICYKSEAHITPESADKFIAGILKSGHESVIEHANLIFSLPATSQNEMALFDCVTNVHGINVTRETENGIDIFVVSGNMRTFRDILRTTGIADFNTLFKTTDGLHIFAQETDSTHIAFSSLKFVSVQNSHFGDKHNYATAHIVCDISLYKDITRHRLCSYSIESTRYCNYSKDKFGNELVMLKPINLKEGTEEYNIWLNIMTQIEKNYMTMAAVSNIKADQLRMMLPHSTKADVMMTCSFHEWKHVFKLRCAKQAHPSVRQGMLKVLDLLHTQYPETFADLHAQYAEDIESFATETIA